MLKAMLFVDADWLCASTLDLGREQGKPDLQIDHRRMGGVLADELGRRHHLGPIDVVRSHYFASRRHDLEAHDPALVPRRRAFLAGLHEPHIELEMVDVDHGGRVAGRDGEPIADSSAVPVALAVAAMRHALTPGVLDLAIFLLGDRCYAPLLRELRRLGRRVALVSVDGSCGAELADPGNPLRVCDFDVLWLHEVVGRIERWRGRRPARAQEDDAAPSEEGAGLSLRGRIKNVIWDRGYGFIAAEDGRDYFFHIHALEPGLEFDQLQPDLTVSFEVKSGPARGRAGAARVVRRDTGAPDEGAALPPERSDAEAAPTTPADQPVDIGGPELRGEEALAPAETEEGR
ncbi:MAG TPA: cold shock domain-containing protein [Geminicoccaceae bacterium]|jgi:cold shock CspA family protein|nr:cold shock domain-containing protein [Geminicoccaceae bacterium]